MTDSVGDCAWPFVFGSQAFSSVLAVADVIHDLNCIEQRVQEPDIGFYLHAKHIPFFSFMAGRALGLVRFWPPPFPSVLAVRKLHQAASAGA